MPYAGWLILPCSALARTHDFKNFLSSIQVFCHKTFTMLWYDSSYRCLCVQSSHDVITFTPLSLSLPECAHLSPSTCKLLFMFLHLILCCPFSYCIPDVIKCRMMILISYFPALRHGFFHVKTVRFVCWHHSLPTFGSEMALSARMSTPSFAGSPRCAFTLTKKVAVPAAILLRQSSSGENRAARQGK